MRFLQYINESLTREQLIYLEKILDKLFNKLGIDVEFTKHFFKRVNDKRNKVPIGFDELKILYDKTYKKYARHFKRLPNNTEAVLKSIQSDINIPFVLKYNKSKKMIDIISKTVMRKKDFKTKDRIYKV